MLQIHSFGQTDIGLKRSNNEDAFLCQPELAVWAVADGMGGASSGEVASGIFADATLEIFSEAAKSEARENYLLVQETFRLANERILSWASHNPEYKGGRGHPDTADPRPEES